MTSAIILAGGFGTRLRSVVTDVPKPLAPVADRPFLEFLLDYWIDQGVGRFILSVGYKKEMIQDVIGESYKGVPVSYVVEENPLGTGGAVILAARELEDDQPFLVLNGDTYFRVSLGEMLEFAAEKASDWLLALFRNDDSQRYMGISLTKEGKITSFVPESANPLVNGGVYLVKNPEYLTGKAVPSEAVSLEQSVFPTALAEGQQFYGVECNEPFIDIGVPEDYQRAEKILISE